jgi:ubiquinone/menaquinone biosynthesis C-methylase UbiE
VVADVANLPFKDEIFDGIISLHTLHHLTVTDYVPAYENLKRVLKKNRTAVIVNGWGESMLMRWISVWRSVSVRFLRAMIHPFLFGRIWLWILFGLEELFPTFFGEKGQYPLITFTK